MRKYIVISALVMLCCSCDPSPEAYFKEKAAGHRAFGLDGTYIFTYTLSDSIQCSDTLKFERIHKNDFLITHYSSNDTLFLGEIVKRKGLYFMNTPAPEEGWWQISAFRFAGDSLYNFWGLDGNSDYYEEVNDGDFFSDFEESDTILHIRNSPSETYLAMEHSVWTGLHAGYRELNLREGEELDNSQAKTTQEPEFLVYPNPVKENLIIETKADGNYRAEIIDMYGKIIRNDKFSENYFTMNVSSVAAGNYVVRIIGRGSVQSDNYRISVVK